MRPVVLSALAFFFALPFAVQAEEAQETQTVDRAAVVAACAQDTVLPEGRTADAATITAYCQCAIDRSAEVMTPEEFSLLARYGVAHANHTPPPPDEELRSIETAEFAARRSVLNARRQNECNPILFGAGR